MFQSSAGGGKPDPAPVIPVGLLQRVNHRPGKSVAAADPVQNFKTPVRRMLTVSIRPKQRSPEHGMRRICFATPGQGSG